MRKLLLLSALLPLAFMARAQSAPDHLDAATFKTKVDQGAATLIDVRTPEEFVKGHLDGAKNIDWNNEDLIAATDKMDRSKPVLLYCAAGGRSEEAMEAMRKAGFKDVHDLSGGINAWRKQGLPVSLK